MRFLVSLFLILSPLQALAQRDGVHAYAAFGVNYSPGSFRIGYKDWEMGMLNRAYGFDKIFDFGTRYYSTFGFVYTGDVGFYSGMGLKFNLWFIPMRCELSGYIDAKASSYASALVGVTYGF